MAKIRKAVLAKITATYEPLREAFRNSGRMAFFYGAEQALVVKVGSKSWSLPVNKRRAARPAYETLSAILADTKVGAKIVKHAERLLIVERAERVKADDTKIRAAMIADLAVTLRKHVPVTFRK